MDKIWANSGDSHFLEPADLWHQIMPKKQADRMPRTEMVSDTESSTGHEPDSVGSASLREASPSPP